MMLTSRVLGRTALRAAERKHQQAARPLARAFRVAAFKGMEPQHKKEASKEVAKMKTEPASVPAPRSDLDLFPLRRMSSMLNEMQREMDTVFGMLSPFGAMRPSSLFANFERLMPSLDVMVPPHATALMAALPVDVAEDEKAYTITAEVPGFSKDEVKVQLSPDEHVLTISGEKKEENEEKGEKGAVVGRTRWMQSFTRSLRLPDNVKASDIQAMTKHGVLTITVPKGELPPPPAGKEIPVKAATE